MTMQAKGWPELERRVARPTAGTAHLWVFRCDVDLPSPTADLDDVERSRAVAFVDPANGRRYAAAHVGLRRILAAYLGLAPGEVPIGRSAAGKPHIANGRDGSHLAFNLSHSGELVAVAVAREGEIGVDVELKRPLDDLDGLSRMVLAPGEAAEMAALATDERLDAFYDIWTRKEALLKAMGSGLMRDPRSVALGIAAPGDRVATFRDDDGSLWSVARFEPGAGTAGAVALNGALHAVERFGFDGA